ncbi:MAG: diguanylate cyclase [Candidatus Sumerlaeaceae bacterium]|nr:diguanylate cyclase [Candidatus Sumerlaeaceae bacterium]
MDQVNQKEEKTAHFSGTGGAVYCFGVPREIRNQLKLHLSYTYEISPITSFQEIRQIDATRTTSGRVALVGWNRTITRRVNFLLSTFRRFAPDIPVCLWCATDFPDEIPAHFLAEQFVDYICPTSHPAHISATLVSLMRRALQMQKIRQQCESLADSSARDSLTALYNHAKILRELDREFRRALRSGSHLSCLMVDIDHFKALNDTYGHRFGDYVLQELSSLLTEEVRSTDIVGRYGGEEFLLILPDCELCGATSLAEKIRTAVENRCFKDHGIEALITVSIGVASTSVGNVATAEQLLRDSDRALYFAKESGRNRVANAHEHSSLSDFEVFRQQRALADSSTPVVAIYSSDNTLIERLVQVAEADKFVVLIFNKPREFLSAFEALIPDLALIDAELVGKGADFLRQFSARLHMRRIAVGVIIEGGAPEVAQTRPKGADFVLPRSADGSAMREILRFALNTSFLERELIRLRQEKSLTQHRLEYKEKLAAVGEAVSTLLSQLPLVTETTGHGALAQGANASEECQTLLTQQLAKLAVVTAQSKHRQAVQLSTLVRRAIREFELGGTWGFSPLSNTIVEQEIPSDIEIFAYETDLITALIELIANAVEAMPYGGKLRLIAEREAFHVLLRIIDTGVGIPAQNLHKIYAPYYSTHAERKALGLGIPIANAIVREHQGMLTFDSVLGKGTIATIRLPVWCTDNELTLKWHITNP